MPARALAFIRALPDHRVIDRLVRGRSWIPVLGVMLAGIVAMQVELLKLNTSVGRSIDLSSALQSRNEILRASVSSLSDSQRIESLATRLGMVMPGPTSILFVDARHATAAQAAASIHAPDPTAFEASLAASEADAQAQSGGTASTPSTADTPSPANTSSTATSTSSGSSTTGASASSPQISSPSATVGPTQSTALSSSQGSTSATSSGTAGAAGLSTGPTSVAPAASAGATATGGQSATGSP